jgi:VWFA-related protein
MARLLSIVLVVFLTALFSSDSQARQQKPQQPGPFRAEAELVTVDVVVMDRRGDPIRDLESSDFTVLEDGRAQTIRFFQPVSATPGASKAAGSTRTYHYSTNVGSPVGPGRAFVLFFDDVNLTQELGDRVKAAVTRFLKEEAQPGDLVSLVAPARGLRWHARLPAGREELLAVLASLTGTNRLDFTHERIGDYEAYRIHVMHDEQVAARVARRFSNYRVAGRDPVNLQRDEGPRPEKKGGTAGLIEPLVLARAAEAYSRVTARNRATLGALADTIESMASVRARKSIVVLSPGFILDQELALFRDVDDAARRANIAMYFVDARGLQAHSVFSSAELGSPTDVRDIGATDADLTLDAEGAVALAESSGGFAVLNRNDLAAGLRRIGHESQVYYLLGYTPGDRRRDGKFRRLEVRVARPGVQVRARKGYYAGGARIEAAARVENDPVRNALESPYDLDGVPVRAAAYSFGNVNPKALSVLIAVEADLRAFGLKPENGLLTDVLDVQVLVTEAATGEAKRHERAVEMSLHSKVPNDETSAWYPVSQSFELGPGRYQARIAVRDRNTGRIGTVTHDFEVPARKGMALSSLIVTDTIEKPADGFTGPPRPVLIVRRIVAAGSTLYYQYSVFDAGRTPAGETHIKAGHAIRRADNAGAIVKEMQPTPLVPGPNGMSRFAGISLAGVPAGEYELVVNVTDEVSGATVQAIEPFAIAEPRQPPGSRFIPR